MLKRKKKKGRKWDDDEKMWEETFVASSFLLIFIPSCPLFPFDKNSLSIPIIVLLFPFLLFFLQDGRREKDEGERRERKKMIKVSWGFHILLVERIQDSLTSTTQNSRLYNSELEIQRGRERERKTFWERTKQDVLLFNSHYPLNGFSFPLFSFTHSLLFFLPLFLISLSLTLFLSENGERNPNRILVIKPLNKRAHWL